MNINTHETWKRVADISEIVEPLDQDVAARVRLAYEFHARATKALADGNIDQFLANASLSGYSADRTRFGQYNKRIADHYSVTVSELVGELVLA